MDDLTKARLAQNAEVFRLINDQVLTLEEQFGSRDGGFLCECADTKCVETTLLPLEEYKRIHADARRFFVVSGHERPEIETVVEHHPNYLVVMMNVPAE